MDRLRRHDGAMSPAGFLPVLLGNVKTDRIVEVYRENALLKDIRAARFHGRCGECEFADLCGGSRSRAFAAGSHPPTAMKGAQFA